MATFDKEISPSQDSAPTGLVWYCFGVPVDGATYLGQIGQGELLLDRTNANLYINTGTKAAPVFKLIAHA